MNEAGLVIQEEEDLRRDAVRRAPGQPGLGDDSDFEMDEAITERRRHVVHHAAVGLAVAAGNHRGTLGEFAFDDMPVEDELVQGRLDHRDLGRQFCEVDEPAPGVVGRRQEGRRRPEGAIGAVAPEDTPQVDRAEKERPEVDVLAVGGRRDLFGDNRFSCPRRALDNRRLAGFDQEGEQGAELARA